MKVSLAGAVALSFALLAISVSGVFPQQETPSFSDVNQIFQARCVKCHSGNRPPVGIRLDNYKDVMAGGKEGPVIVPGKPDKSQLLKNIKGTAKPRMPKDAPPFLSEKDIALIEKWIAAGAPE